MGISKEAQSRRVANSLCPLCAKPWKGDTRYCKACNKKDSEYKKIDRKKRKKLGVCVECWDKLDRVGIRCSPCNEVVVKATTALAKRRRQSGVCMWCADTKVLCDKYKLCKMCWFKRASLRVVGNFSLGNKLHELYLSQQGKCFYTGAKLKIGVNASLDHQKPRTRNGAHNIRNFQWVSIIINRMKQNMTHKEFVFNCKLIGSRF